MVDTSGGGLSQNCILNTPEGLTPLDWLRPGDMIETADGGFQPIVRIEKINALDEPAVQIAGVEGRVFAGSEYSGVRLAVADVFWP